VGIYLHMSGGTKTHTTLGGALIATHLEVDNSLAGLKLFLTELADVLGGFFGPNAGDSEITSLLN